MSGGVPHIPSTWKPAAEGSQLHGQLWLYKVTLHQPGVVVYAFNSITQEAEVGGSF